MLKNSVNPDAKNSAAAGRAGGVTPRFARTRPKSAKAHMIF
jgi:hypothetical protein